MAPCPFENVGRTLVYRCAVDSISCLSEVSLCRGNLPSRSYQVVLLIGIQITHKMEALILSCPSHNVLPLAGACLCPLCHCGQVVSRTGLDLNGSINIINLVLSLITWQYQNCNLLRTIAIHQSVDEWYGLIDFHWKNTDFHHEIVAWLNVGVRGEEAWSEGVGLESARQRTASHGHKRPCPCLPQTTTHGHEWPPMSFVAIRGRAWSFAF